MNLPTAPVSLPGLIGILAIVGLAVAYFVFLWASWQQYQRDREHRNNVIDTILERLPKAAKDVPSSEQ